MKKDYSGGMYQRVVPMAFVAKGIAAKVSSNTSAVVTTAIKKMIGYEANAFIMGTEQTDKVKFFFFAMFTIIPAVTGSPGIIPMLFYDLNNDKKDKMYAELHVRRKLMSDAVESDDENMLKIATEAQISVGEKTHRRKFMEIRYITPSEAIDFQKVSAASFIWKFNAEEDNTVKVPVLAAFQDGKLIAGVEMFDFKSNYCGNFLNSLAISGVCSLPECRRMGGIRAAFKKIGETAVENDWTLGFLHPFSISYYEKLGYANLNRMFIVKVPFKNMKNIPRNNDVVLYTGEQFEELRALHAKCALKENLMTLREDKKHFCDIPLESADYTYFRRNESGEADGYVRFTVDRPNTLFVEDLYFLSPEALYGLIGFLRNYDGIVKDLAVRKQYQGSPFACLADRIDGVVYEYNGGTAGRIYNMKKLLESNAYPEEYGKFSILSRDDLEQNAGIFEVEYQNGKASVTHKAGGDYDIALTASAAARLMLAGEGHTAQTAVYIDGAEINGNADDFFRAFPHRPTRFDDSLWSV